MRFLLLLLLLCLGLAATYAHAHTIPSHSNAGLRPHPRAVQPIPVPVPARACGTGPPSAHLLAAHARLSAARSSSSSSTSTSSKPSTSRIRPRKTTPKYTIDTYFHVVSSAAAPHAVTPAMVANQFGALEAAYASSALSFRLRATTYTVNDSWATDVADHDMKAALRQGNYSALNLYFQTNLSSSATGPGTGSGTGTGTGTGTTAGSILLGYCTLPSNVTYAPCAGCALAEFPAADYLSDGCNVLAGSMPGGGVPGYAQGKTAVHEVGHWLGLLHTFQDGSCVAGDAGDFIADTPQQGTASAGCPVGKDSCPGLPGVDAVHNFMDYSDDA
ncbi:hypothetical protein MMC19_007768, partial [Ptychographa xylographoides]|nr:hypothetical protein [Ptychographa xylographoides]